MNTSSRKRPYESPVDDAESSGYGDRNLQCNGLSGIFSTERYAIDVISDLQKALEYLISVRAVVSPDGALDVLIAKVCFGLC